METFPRAALTSLAHAVMIIQVLNFHSKHYKRVQPTNLGSYVAHLVLLCVLRLHHFGGLRCLFSLRSLLVCKLGFRNAHVLCTAHAAYNVAMYVLQQWISHCIITVM